MKSISIGILGATSYTGAQLLRLLAFHPHASVAFIASQSYAGKRLSEVFPEMLGICDQVLISPEDASTQSVECLFSCLPHAVSAAACMPFIARGTKIIDLSADFRIKNVADYTKWYKEEHPCSSKLAEAVFGLP